MHNNRSQMNVVDSAKNSNLELVGGVVWLILFNEVSAINAGQMKTMLKIKGVREQQDSMSEKFWRPH